MATNHFYDETHAHEVIVRAMAARRPLWRSALLGAYIELVSCCQKKAYAAALNRAAETHVDDMVTYGDIVAIEPLATDELIVGLIDCGYLTYHAGDQYRLIKHHKFVHWEPAMTLQWRLDKKRDLNNEALRAMVRYRDGDQCRICRVVVHWTGPQTDTKGELDHVNPQTPADGDPAALAVACRRCNLLRSDRPDANTFAPHQPEPDHPYYTKATADWLAARGYKTQKNGTPMQKVGQAHIIKPVLEIKPPARRKAAQDSRDPAPSGIPRTTPSQAPAGPVKAARPATQADTAPPHARPVTQADTALRDPASSGIPRDPQIRPKSDRNPITGFDAGPPIPPAKPPPDPWGVHVGEGKGREGEGLRPGARRRARRGRSPSRHAQTQPEENQQ